MAVCAAQSDRLKNWSILIGTMGLLLNACAPSKLAYGQVKSAMIDAGLSEPTAACMANRMTDKLNLLQLNRL